MRNIFQRRENSKRYQLESFIRNEYKKDYHYFSNNLGITLDPESFIKNNYNQSDRS